MKYLKIFNKVSDYEAFKEGDYITPNISYVEETEGLVFEPAVIENDSGLNFPIYLVEGENGQKGIDLWNYMLKNATDTCLPGGMCYPGYYTFKSNEVVVAILPNGNSVNIPEFHFGGYVGEDLTIPSKANYATPDWWNIVIRPDGSVIMANIGDV